MYIGQELIRGERLVSENGKFILDFQEDGDFVLKINGVPLWRTLTTGKGERFVIQDDGTTAIYDSSNEQVYYNGISFVFMIKVENNGEIVVTNDKQEKLFWSDSTAHSMFIFISVFTFKIFFDGSLYRMDMYF